MYLGLDCYKLARNRTMLFPPILNICITWQHSLMNDPLTLVILMLKVSLPLSFHSSRPNKARVVASPYGYLKSVFTFTGPCNNSYSRSSIKDHLVVIVQGLMEGRVKALSQIPLRNLVSISHSLIDCLIFLYSPCSEHNTAGLSWARLCSGFWVCSQQQ